MQEQNAARTLLVLSTTYPRWRGDSAPGFVHDLCAELAKDFCVHVLAPHAAGAMRDEVMDGVHVMRFRYLPETWQRLNAGGGILPTLRARPWLVWQAAFLCTAMFVRGVMFCRQRRVHAIHAHWVLPSGWIALWLRRFARRPRAIKVIVTSHGADLFALRGFFWRAMMRRVLQKVDRVFVVSQAMKDFCRRELKLRDAVHANISVQPMGIDCEKVFVDPGGDAARAGFLFVGRLVEKKGVRVLLRAFAQFVKHSPQETLTLVGDGGEKKALQQLASELGLDANVIFAGAASREQVAGFYKRAEVCVVPSVVAGDGDREGLGLVVAEALACGCVTLASDLPAIRDVHTDEQLRFRAGDVDDLHAKMQYVAANREQALARCEVMRGAVVRDFSLPVVARRYREVLA